MSTELIFHAWKQAFGLFSKKESLLFLLGWLNTFRRSSIIFLKYSWWLVAFEVGLRFQLFPSFVNHILNHHPLVTTTLVTTLTMISIYFAILSIRASVETKDFFYFATQAKKIPFFALLYFLFFALFSPPFISFYPKITFLVQGTVGISLFLSFFFLLDNIPLAQALKNGFKAYLVYFPSFLALYLSYLFVFFLITTQLSFIHHSLYYTSLNLLHFFFVCAIGMLYIKLRHNFYTLFFQS